MTDQEYQKNILMELMNIEEFKIQINSNKSTAANPEPKNIKISKTSLNPYDSKNINDLTSIIHNFLVEKSLKLSNNKINLVEGNKDSKILFLYGYCKKSDTKIIDGE